MKRVGNAAIQVSEGGALCAAYLAKGGSMNPSRNLLLKQILLTAALAACISGDAIANRGGDNGDNSMNPFTGDSYAYFHGGHNLGEQGTIRPDRPPPAKSKPVWGRKSSRSPDSAASAKDQPSGAKPAEQSTVTGK
jgi:hypothetical protein